MDASYQTNNQTASSDSPETVVDPSVLQLVKQWHTLPPEMKAAIATMIESVGKGRR
jgi:hypothetical protein